MHSLAAAIERLSAKWSLPARNVSTSTAPSRGAIAGREPAGEQRGGGHRPVVALVAHGQRLADQRGDVDRLRRLDGGVEDRPEHLGHPAQPVDDLRPVGAEAQHRAQPLVQGGEGVPRRRPGVVDDLPDRHRRGDHAGHRADGPVVVARLDGDLARGERPLGLRRRRGPALEEGRADQGAAHRPAHPASTRSAARRAAWCAPGRPARRSPRGPGGCPPRAGARRAPRRWRRRWPRPSSRRRGRPSRAPRRGRRTPAGASRAASRPAPARPRRSAGARR